jgi:hypothetical protein
VSRKLKRVLFITVWARSRRPAWRSDSDASDDSAEWPAPSSSPGKNERFVGWSESAGAGARAMGLRAWA